MAKIEVAERDRKLGSRVGRKWRAILKKAKVAGYSEDQVRGFVKEGGLLATDAQRKKIAAGLGFDWEGAAEFFSTIMPIIMEMMASCG
jgi:hypothetical protein